MADETQQQQAQPENAVDPLILKAALQRLRSEQNLILAVLAGGAAALLGAGVWAAVTFATGFQIGWMAVGVGFLVGYAVRTFGKGIDKSFAVVGAVWSLAGCAVGNLLSVIGVISQQQNIPFFDILEKLNPEIVANPDASDVQSDGFAFLWHRGVRRLSIFVPPNHANRYDENRLATFSE